MESPVPKESIRDRMQREGGPAQAKWQAKVEKRRANRRQAGLPESGEYVSKTTLSISSMCACTCI